ncbi:recombinase family protein [Sphingomicrobium flavum]|uniref:recombinase family protein n=1 Tax=Sphingomicrobium flavum TaxID=1229164 RepID=UPI0021ADD6CE|nr:recombinase family protein [Sphingomicrobium flavum]
MTHSDDTSVISKRCAIYTRKSTERGLELKHNSLETQREICSAYVRSQEHRGWREIDRHYDDGGYSGGSLERPALKRLIQDIERGRVDIVVIYKIDRLTRSILDFVRLAGVLERYGAQVVSVTQSFDTSDSMGRLILNILLTFAQFEREMMADRVRDKKLQLITKGRHPGGPPSFGYYARDGKLMVDHERMRIVRELYASFPKAESLNHLVRRFRADGITTRRRKTKTGRQLGGDLLSYGIILRILSNPIYTGSIQKDGEWIKCELPIIISRGKWEQTQDLLKAAKPPTSNRDYHFLLDLLHDDTGGRMSISNRKTGHQLGDRYYRSKRQGEAGWGPRYQTVVADRVEALAVAALQGLLLNPSKLGDAILSLGLYGNETKRALGLGALAAKRLGQLQPRSLRPIFKAVVPRMELYQHQLRMFISSAQLLNFLLWDGAGLFGEGKPLHPRANFIYRHDVAAPYLCGKMNLALPIVPKDGSDRSPDEHLVNLLKEAARFQRLMMKNRHLSTTQLAHLCGTGRNHFVRVFRLNYLAPDIQAAIYDGRQPDGMHRRHLLQGALPLDWEAQRQALGFGSKPLRQFKPLLLGTQATA